MLRSRPSFCISFTERGIGRDLVVCGPDPGAGCCRAATYAAPDNQLVGILLTQTGMSTPDSARARFLIYPDEGHGFEDPHNQRDFIDRALAWIDARCS
ncbi:hypothetical protein [Nonomuraea sp. NPDC049400]|uniref:hypothetical protein n=1 Tax=Nonomuraea sp. NPDC049400 TaxID=3364352 RepID=UPI0037B9892E